MNQLNVVALNEGVRRKKALWRPAGRSELESLVLAPWASRRRQDLLHLLDQLTPKIQELTRTLEAGGTLSSAILTRSSYPARSKLTYSPLKLAAQHICLNCFPLVLRCRSTCSRGIPGGTSEAPGV